MTIDLHTHTTASDGELSPKELLERASLAGVRLLAITDHDTIDGLLAAQSASPQAAEAVDGQPRLISGVELSSRWGRSTVHVLGLNFDPHCLVMAEFLRRQAELRAERNERILSRLERLGFEFIRPAMHDTGRSLSELGRPQIARALVDHGAVASVDKAFKSLLAAGKPAAVAVAWPSLIDAVDVIRTAGGLAVLAHPLKYKLTGTRLRGLIQDFKAAGGRALEVVSGGQNAAQIQQLAKLATRFELKASQGSDFHSAALPWQALGRLPAMPAECQPIWQDFQLEPVTVANP